MFPLFLLEFMPFSFAGDVGDWLDLHSDLAREVGWSKNEASDTGGKAKKMFSVLTVVATPNSSITSSHKACFGFENYERKREMDRSHLKTLTPTKLLPIRSLTSHTKSLYPRFSRINSLASWMHAKREESASSTPEFPDTARALRLSHQDLYSGRPTCGPMCHIMSPNVSSGRFVHFQTAMVKGP